MTTATAAGTRIPQGPETLDAILELARSTLDLQMLETIGERHRKGSERKYLAYEDWLRKKWQMVQLLGLDRGPKLRILDLGTGPAHFPYICRYLGHDCLALDMPGIPLYDELCRWIGIEKLDFKIEPRTPLPRFAEPFDLVTAFMIGFNTKSDGTLFNLDEWNCFLDDVRDNLLVPGGRLALKMIKQTDRQGPKFVDPELQALFAARGARLVPEERLAIFVPLT